MIPARPPAAAPLTSSARPSAASVPAGLWLVGLSLPWLLLWLLPPINHDVAALLQFTDRWLAGAALYRDLIDVNPPLIFLLSAVPVALARASGLPVVVAFDLALLLFTGLVGAMLWRRAGMFADRPVVHRVLLAVVPFAVLGLGNSMAGQREQLLALAALPWLFDSALAAEGGRRRSLVAALLAAVGFCIKPHFLLIPVLVEGALLLRRGRAQLQDPLPWCFVLVPAGYALLVWRFFPAYSGVVLPLALSDYRAFGGMSGLDVLVQRQFATPLVLLLACLPLLLAGDALITTVGLAALGAVGGAVLQAKGWGYHYLPAEMLIAILVGLVVARWVGRIAAEPARAAVGVALGALVLGNAYALGTRAGPWEQLGHAGSQGAVLGSEIAAIARGQPVLVLSPAVGPIYPALLAAGAWQAMRFMTLWPLNVFYPDCGAGLGRYHDPEAMRPHERLVFEAVGADLARLHPPAIVVDRFTDMPFCGGKQFDYLEYFLREPVFAETFADYRLTRDDGRFRIFTRLD